MLIAAIVFFSLAVVLGLFLLSYVLRSKSTPKGVAFVHGPLAVIGLILLIVYAAYQESPPWISIILFVLAAIGGLFLIYKDLSGDQVPKSFAIGHGMIALIGFIYLIVFTMSQSLQ